MRRLGRLALAIVLLLATGTGITHARGGEAHLLLGQRAASENRFDAAGVDGQSQFGVAVSLDFDWPVHLAVDLLSSSDDSTRVVSVVLPLELDTDVDVTELDLGVRKFWRDRGIRPYVGGGLALVRLDVRQIENGSLGPGNPFSTLIVDDDDTGVGLWLNGGFIYRVGDHFNVGLDLRYGDADADLAPAQPTASLKLDSGGFQYGVALGYHW